MIKWFAANKLVLNLDKPNIRKFVTKSSTHSALCIGYIEKYTEEMVNSKFLGLQSDKHLKWKNHKNEWFVGYVEYVMVLGLRSISVTVTFSNQFTMHTFILL